MISQIIAQVKNCGDPTTCTTTLPQISADKNNLQAGLTVVFGVAAAMAVLMIMIAALHYVTSDGDPETISRSKKTIIFSLVGLILALFAEAIVLTVLGKL